MSWVVISKGNVLGRLAQGEFEAYEAAGNHTDDEAAVEVDKLAEIISQVTTLVRGKVSSCRENIPKMGQSGTIPDECLFAACTIARDALVGSLPLSEGATETRKEELRNAHAFLNSVANCQVRIADATGEIEPSATSASYYGGAPLIDF